MKVPFLRASFSPPSEWVPFLDESYRQNWFTNFGPLYKRFCGTCDERYAAEGYRSVLVSNATIGLTAALVGQDVKGDVVLPAFTFPATLQAVIGAGCQPVLCDVDPNTWEIDERHLRALLDSRRIGAIVPVRPFGFMRDMSRVFAIGRDYRCPVIVDAAAAFGHPGQQHAIGSAEGQIEVFSLHATKVFSVGEGGLIFAPRDAADAIERAMNFGFNPDRSFGDGMNAKVDEVRCAVGLAGLGAIDEIVAARTRLAEAYIRLFSAFPQVVSLPRMTGPTPWQTFPVRFKTPQQRTNAVAALAKSGVETRPYYTPSLGSGYKGRHGGGHDATPVSEALSQTVLCFPVYQSMTAEEHAYVLAETRTVLERADVMANAA